MKAEVTAENRPAYDASQHACAWTMHTTYEYQRRVQIFIMFLEKFLIIFLGLLAVMFVEFAAKILGRWRQAFFLAGRGF